MFGLLTGAILGGTSLISGVLGSNAAGNAASIQQQNAQNVANMATSAGEAGQGTVNLATDQANNTLQNVFGSEQANLDPYLATGLQGTSDLSRDLNPGGSLTTQFQAPTAAQAAATPGYQFQLQQGELALQRSAAATGQVLGGGTLKALDQYSQGLASTTYQNAYNNALNTFQTNRNNLMNSLGLAIGTGQNATSQLDAAVQNYGNTKSSNLMGGATERANLGMSAAQIAGSALTGGANAQAAGQIGQANAWSNALGGVANGAVLGTALSLGYDQPPQSSSSSSSSAPPGYGVPNSTFGNFYNSQLPAPPPVSGYASGYAPPPPFSTQVPLPPPPLGP